MIGRARLSRAQTRKAFRDLVTAVLIVAGLPISAWAREPSSVAPVKVISGEELQKTQVNLQLEVPFVRQLPQGAPPDSQPNKDMRAVLERMNAARSKVGSSPLIWHPILAQGAQQTANRIALPGGALEHTPITIRGAAGENIAGGPGRFAAPILNQIWLDEEQFFNPGVFPNVCDSGEWQQCGHFTQIIDFKSIFVGCGGVEGANSSLVCWFFPAGNVRGQPVLGPPQTPFGQPPLIAAGPGGAMLPAGDPFDIREAFAEVRIPILEDSYIYNLSLESGYRYSDYGVPGRSHSTDTYKFEGDWAPVRDIRFRGSYNRAVRAPNIQELFAPDRIVLDPGSYSCGPAAGGFDVSDAFAELRLPLLSDISFFHRLELTGAPRYSDYATSGPSTFSAGIDWQPIEDLLFRGSWAEGFRAPSIGELFGAPSRLHGGLNADPVDACKPDAETDAVLKLFGDAAAKSGFGVTPSGR